MSELTDLVIQTGEQFGWDALLFIFVAFQIYWPDKLHPKSGTKFKQLMRSTDPAVEATLEAIAEEMDKLDEDAVRNLFNGGEIRPEDVKRDPTKLRS